MTPELELAVMNMIEHLRRLFRYDDWANREVLDALQAAAKPPARSLQLLAHILSAQRLWLERLQRQTQTLPVWPEFALPQCKKEATELQVLWRDYLANLQDSDLSASINYKNSKGESWTSQNQDVLLHVVMHSVYHRGQIAADMRANGMTPAYTDFIHAVRQRFVG